MRAFSFIISSSPHRPYKAKKPYQCFPPGGYVFKEILLKLVMFPVYVELGYHLLSSPLQKASFDPAHQF